MGNSSSISGAGNGVRTRRATLSMAPSRSREGRRATFSAPSSAFFDEKNSFDDSLASFISSPTSPSDDVLSSAEIDALQSLHSALSLITPCEEAKEPICASSPNSSSYSGPDLVSQLPRDIGKFVLNFLDFKVHADEHRIAKQRIREGRNSQRRSLTRLQGWRNVVQSVFLRETIDWKGVCRDKWRQRVCFLCSRRFRECENYVEACLTHPGIRELFTNRTHPGPSGMYWSCCAKKEKDDLGCVRSRHMEGVIEPVKEVTLVLMC